MNDPVYSTSMTKPADSGSDDTQEVQDAVDATITIFENSGSHDTRDVEEAEDHRIIMLFQAMDQFHLVEEQHYKVRGYQNEVSIPSPFPMYPDVLFGIHGIGESLLSNVAAGMRGYGSMAQFRGHPFSIEPLNAMMIRSNENIERANVKVNATPHMEPQPPVIGHLFPVTVHFIPPHHRDLECVREAIREFEKKYVVYSRLVTAYEWTFDDGKVNIARGANYLPGYLFNDNCIEFYRDVLLGKIAVWILDNESLWMV